MAPSFTPRLPSAVTPASLQLIWLRHQCQGEALTQQAVCTRPPRRCVRGPPLPRDDAPCCLHPARPVSVHLDGITRSHCCHAVTDSLRNSPESALKIIKCYYDSRVPGSVALIQPSELPVLNPLVFLCDNHLPYTHAVYTRKSQLVSTKGRGLGKGFRESPKGSFHNYYKYTLSQ